MTTTGRAAPSAKGTGVSVSPMWLVLPATFGGGLLTGILMKRGKKTNE